MAAQHGALLVLERWLGIEDDKRGEAEEMDSRQQYL